MAIELNHTIVPASNPQASAQFLAGILGLPVGPPVAHFTPVTLANGVSLDFDRYDHVHEHHYAFQLGEEEFKAALSRIQKRDITHYADPACREPGQTYTSNGCRGTYFRDPDGHLMEILTFVPPEPVCHCGQPSRRERPACLQLLRRAGPRASPG
ncbi:MAG TPA: VOC family protein [Trebonia sp.]|nr:VOC family protein [Trebonia sp.]